MSDFFFFSPDLSSEVKQAYYECVRNFKEMDDFTTFSVKYPDQEFIQFELKLFQKYSVIDSLQLFVEALEEFSLSSEWFPNLIFLLWSLHQAKLNNYQEEAVSHIYSDHINGTIMFLELDELLSIMHRKFNYLILEFVKLDNRTHLDDDYPLDLSLRKFSQDEGIDIETPFYELREKSYRGTSTEYVVARDELVKRYLKIYESNLEDNSID